MWITSAKECQGLLIFHRNFMGGIKDDCRKESKQNTIIQRENELAEVNGELAEVNGKLAEKTQELENQLKQTK